MKTILTSGANPSRRQSSSEETFPALDQSTALSSIPLLRERISAFIETAAVTEVFDTVTRNEIASLSSDAAQARALDLIRPITNSAIIRRELSLDQFTDKEPAPEVLSGMYARSLLMGEHREGRAALEGWASYVQSLQVRKDILPRVDDEILLMRMQVAVGIADQIVKQNPEVGWAVVRGGFARGRAYTSDIDVTVFSAGGHLKMFFDPQANQWRDFFPERRRVFTRIEEAALQGARAAGYDELRAISKEYNRSHPELFVSGKTRLGMIEQRFDDLPIQLIRHPFHPDQDYRHRFVGLLMVFVRGDELGGGLSGPTRLFMAPNYAPLLETDVT